MNLLDGVLLGLGVLPLLDCGVLYHENGAPVLLGGLDTVFQQLELILRHRNGVFELPAHLFCVSPLLLIRDYFPAPVIFEGCNHLQQVDRLKAHLRHRRTELHRSQAHCLDLGDVWRLSHLPVPVWN